MTLVLIVVCVLLVAIPLLILAVLVRGTVGRLGRLQGRAKDIQPAVAGLTERVTTLQQSVSSIRGG